MHSCGFGSRTDEGMKPDDKEINIAMFMKYSCLFAHMCFLKSVKVFREVPTEKEKLNEQTYTQKAQPTNQKITKKNPIKPNKTPHKSQ